MTMGSAKRFSSAGSALKWSVAIQAKFKYDAEMLLQSDMQLYDLAAFI